MQVACEESALIHLPETAQKPCWHRHWPSPACSKSIVHIVGPRRDLQTPSVQVSTPFTQARCCPSAVGLKISSGVTKCGSGAATLALTAVSSTGGALPHRRASSVVVARTRQLSKAPGAPSQGDSRRALYVDVAIQGADRPSREVRDVVVRLLGKVTKSSKERHGPISLNTDFQCWCA